MTTSPDASTRVRSALAGAARTGQTPRPRRGPRGDRRPHRRLDDPSFAAGRAIRPTPPTRSARSATTTITTDPRSAAGAALPRVRCGACRSCPTRVGPLRGGSGCRAVSDAPSCSTRPARCSSRQGYHAAAMDDIAEAAGVSKPVLYQHFPGKLELYLALLDPPRDALVAAVRGALASTDDNKLRVQATIAAYFDFVDARRRGVPPDLRVGPDQRGRSPRPGRPHGRRLRAAGQPGHRRGHRAHRARPCCSPPGSPAWPRPPRGTGCARGARSPRPRPPGWSARWLARHLAHPAEPPPA